jgi:hypothetical protein
MIIPTTHCNRWTLCCPETLKVNHRLELKKGMLLVDFDHDISGAILVKPFRWSNDRLNWLMQREVVIDNIYVADAPCVLESARTIWRTLMSIGYDIHPSVLC